MCTPLSPFHRYIEINITDNRHFALVYLLGITRQTVTGLTAQEPSIYKPQINKVLKQLLLFSSN